MIVMTADQLLHLPDGFIIEFQSPQNPACQFFTDLLMTAKMVNAISIRCLCLGLSKIMEQHGKPKDFVCLHLTHGFDGMHSYGVTMMGIVLLTRHAGVKFRQHHSSHTRLPCFQKPFRMGRYQ